MATLASKLSWFYFQLLFPLNQGNYVLLNFIFDDFYWYYFGKCFWLALSFQL